MDVQDPWTYQTKPLRHIKINDQHLHYASEMSDSDVNRTYDYERPHKMYDHKYSPNHYAAKIKKVNPSSLKDDSQIYRIPNT